jgi:(S)-2-hydroxyglutarate dehydrogenase
MPSQTYHTTVIGAGLVGLSVAYHLKLKNPKCKILLLEKEPSVAKHQSGNNSGVIHSGIYYKPGSLKATNCIEGYNSLLEFAQIHKIPFDICGKIIVATSKQEISKLHEIYNRGTENGLSKLRHLKSQNEIHELEPHCFGVEGIHVPQTGIIDYPKVAETLLDIYKSKYEGEALFEQKVLKITKQRGLIYIETNNQTFISENVISCAGLYSDKLSELTEVENNLRIIPFRGEYYKLREEKNYLVKNLIYPVPDPN